MADEESRVKVVEICKVTPCPTSNIVIPDSIPLTFFDLIWLKLPPLQRLFFYETSASFYSDILPRLKHSLSITLRHFLPLCGNIVWPESSTKPFICIENGGGGCGVSFTVAESSFADDFFRISADGVVEAEALHPLVPVLAASDERAELLAIQVSWFPGAGFSVGMSMHHAAVDGLSSNLFRETWSKICRLGEPAAVIPDRRLVFDRSVIPDKESLDDAYAEQLREANSRGPNSRSVAPWGHMKVRPDSVRGTFRLTPENIEKLRSQEDQQTRFSTLCIAFAYAVVCAVKAEGCQGRVLLILNFDCRSRIEPNVPDSYIGNCTGSSRVSIPEPEALIGPHGLAVAARAVDEAIKGIDGEFRNNKKDWLSRLVTRFTQQNSSNGERSRAYVLAGSDRLDLYGGVDFGWGRPKKVELVSIDRTRAFSMSCSRDGDGGVEIGLVLNRLHMKAFASLFAQGLK